ncbi:MAG TPA: outer membrane lipoprotein carrier protein LolA [Hyphomicrobiaceae bacterium]|nr:outer membrane lipoprotein carrier protein LolA [Hyphomicrobiaceae bacterium]
MSTRFVLAAAFTCAAASLALAADGKPAASAGATVDGSAWSAEVAPGGTSGITLDPTQSDVINKVNTYFNTLDNLSGRFVQTAADGKVMKGKFVMKRPGRFRFDYARPSLQVIISDGTNLAIQDHDLNNEDRIQLDQTPFRLLLRKDVDLVRDARISEVQDGGGRIAVTLRDKSPDTSGAIRLVFTTEPTMELKEWITRDAQGLDTKVEVGDLDRTKEVDARQFVIRPMGAAFNRR